MSQGLASTLVKVKFRCSDRNKRLLQNSNCVLLISVGQAYHEGDKLLTTMDLINRTFKSCTIMLCDTLQRHTLKLDYPALSDKNSRENALTLGDEWLVRNKLACENLTINWEVKRWDDWLSHPRYSYWKKRVMDLYAENIDYQRSIASTINCFLDRRGLLSSKVAFARCEAYLLEECPVIMPLWAEIGYQFILYPQARSEAMKATQRYLISSQCKQPLLEEVNLTFKKRKRPVGHFLAKVENDNFSLAM